MLYNETINIVCAVDDAYSMPLAVTLRSVLQNINDQQKINFFVIDGGIRPKNKQKIIQSLSFRPFTIDWLKPCTKLLANAKVSGHVSIATYFRILIPEIIPNDIKKIIYLDCDLLVLNNIGKLWNIDMGEAPLLACQEVGIPYVSSDSGLLNYQKLRIPENSKYFNAGVLLINLEKWRSEGISAKVIDYLDVNKDYIRWWDQDALNAIFAQRWKELDHRWNQTPAIHSFKSWKDSPLTQDKYELLLNDPFIVHFASCFKPWNSTEHHPANDLFFEYVDLTAWAGWRYNVLRQYKNKFAKKANEIKTFLKVQH